MCPSSYMAIVVRHEVSQPLALPVRADIAIALLESIRTALGEMDSWRLGDLCAQDLIGLLSSINLGDARPPSVAQVKFGLDISRRLNLELPLGALQDRAVMGRFISRYADLLRSTPHEPTAACRSADQAASARKDRRKKQQNHRKPRAARKAIDPSAS